MGIFKILTMDSNKLCVKERVGLNTLTISGRRFINDRVFSTGAHNWNELRIGWLGIGDSTDTNSGLEGPSPGSNLAKNATAWRGASPYDWTLSGGNTFLTSGYARRTGETVYLTGRFANSTFSAYFAGTAMLPILEMGCFLYNEDDGWGAATLPENNPIEDTSQEKRAMICRQVRYTETVDEYVADPIAKTDDGYAIGITYEFNYSA